MAPTRLWRVQSLPSQALAWSQSRYRHARMRLSGDLDPLALASHGSAGVGPCLGCARRRGPSGNKPAFAAARARRNNGRIRLLISRGDAAHNASAFAVDAIRALEVRIMVAHGFRNLQKRQL